MKHRTYVFDISYFLKMSQQWTEFNTKLFINCLGAFQKQFSSFFKDIDIWKFEWVRNSFAVNVSGLMTCEQEHHVHTSCDISSKDLFDADKLLQFWLLVRKTTIPLKCLEIGVRLITQVIYFNNINTLLINNINIHIHKIKEVRLNLCYAETAPLCESSEPLMKVMCDSQTHFDLLFTKKLIWRLYDRLYFINCSCFRQI